MSLKAPNFKGLQAQAMYHVDEPFEHGDIQSLSGAVQNHIEIYLGITHQAGARAAELVESLPYPEKEGGYVDAFMALHILRSTQAALKSILEDDAEMNEMVNQYYQTTDADDAEARREAAQFNKDHYGDLDEEFKKSAEGFVDDRVSEQVIMDAAAGGSHAQQEADLAEALKAKTTKIEVRAYPEGVERGKHDQSVADVSAEKLPITESAFPTPTPVRTPESAPVQSSEPTSSIDEEGPLEDLALKLFQERPTRYKVEAPNYSKRTPGEAFRAAAKWMFDHIIIVAAGSRTPSSYPRIAPLMSKTVTPEYAQTVASLDGMVRAIRHHVSKLRVSGEDDHGLGKIRAIFDNFDSSNPEGIADAFKDALEGLRGGPKDDTPSYENSAQEGIYG
jgi:hypothetical protein